MSVQLPLLSNRQTELRHHYGLQRKALFTLFYCSFSFVTLASCNEVQLYKTDSASSPPKFSEISPILGVKSNVHRITRSSNYYSSLPSFAGTVANADTTMASSAADENALKNSRYDRDRRNDVSYLAAYGFRTKYKPQKFYANKPSTHTSTAATAIATTTLINFNLTNDLTSFNLITGSREDICVKHCTCTRIKNAFLTVNCDFQANQALKQVFGTFFKVPIDATSITIKLASNTNFRLERGFFNNNTVNSITIEGTGSEREQVEITSEAFQDNNGPYPEIHMNNVFSVIVRTKAFSGNGKFTVRNSNDLILYENAFENAKINGLFVGINDLRIWEKAFNSAQAKLRIESSHIDNIFRFEASLREIRFVNCSIGTINGGTFDVNNINSIVFESCRIDTIKARAITEKLFSKHVSITGAIIGSIESEAIYGSGISELFLTRNNIDSIHENAIHVTAINATIARNNIKHLGNNWLRVKEWSNIIVEKNKFGEFGPMWLEETKQPVVCRFDGNSITQPKPGSLNITNPYCILREISVDMPCRCNQDWLLELSGHDLRSETYCTIDDKLGHCFNASTFNSLKYLNEVCDDTKTTLDCVANMNLKKIDGNFFTLEELEQQNKQLPLIILISVTVIVIPLIASILMAIYCCKKQKYNQAINLPPISNGSMHYHDFSSDDRRIITQALQLMQKKYPDIYKRVNEHTQLLLQNNLPNKKCVTVISQIVYQLHKIDNGEEDLAAFNRVLTQHLQPPLPSAPPASDPIYTEPSLACQDAEDFYTSSSFEAVPRTVTNMLHDSTVQQEHIYAEPQQPLLPTEYASPADRNLDSMDLYAEPVNGRDIYAGNEGAYAVSVVQQQQCLPQYPLPVLKQQKQQKQQPYKLPIKPSKNLPDVIHQHNNNITEVPTPLSLLPSTSLSSLQQQRQLPFAITTHTKPQPPPPLVANCKEIGSYHQNMPKFQINSLLPSSTHTFRLHGNPHFITPTPPIYTAPDVSRKQRPVTEARLALPEIADGCDLDMRGAMALPLDSGSDHSGGSEETIKIDDVIEYADA